MSIDAMKKMVAALEESLDLVEQDYDTDWRHGLPTRKAQLDGKLDLLNAHKEAIAAGVAAIESAQKVEPVAWMSPGKERLEFSRPDTVYGSHTIPLYKHPVASQFSVGVIDSDGYLYPDHPLEPGTVLYTTPQQPTIPDGWQLVPLEPTPEMLDAYMKANKEYWFEYDKLDAPIGKWCAGTVKQAFEVSYKAMLAAAPKPENSHD